MKRPVSWWTRQRDARGHFVPTPFIAPTTRRCLSCNELKAGTDFYRGNAKCKACVISRVASYQSRHRAWVREWNKRWADRLRMEVLSHYSGGVPRCRCCGEREVAFLTIDHAKNDGAADRRRGLRAHRLWSRLRRQSFPDGFRVLCYNCNCAKGAYGMCPHERRERRAEVAAS